MKLDNTRFLMLMDRTLYRLNLLKFFVRISLGRKAPLISIIFYFCVWGVAITFYTPQGTFFTNDSTSASYKVITAQVRIKGKLASAAQRIPFYWGSENVGIVSGNGYYNKYLGRGWKCLNDKNVIQNSGEDENDMSKPPQMDDNSNDHGYLVRILIF